MRPRRLEMTAFGPYPGTEVVDFDDLGRFGMFVVSGPTGSGKTSIFDAICWALYGRLPGYKKDHSKVTSHHVAPGVECSVSLTFDARGHTWKVDRTPRQEVLRKRGSGTKVEPASATLLQLVGDVWTPHVSGAEAVTSRAEELTGLTLAQFQQVVLLPQGRFQQVLQASSKERSALLSTLFQTERFKAIQESLKERSATAAAAVAADLEAARRDLEACGEFVDQARAASSTQHAEAASPAGPDDPSAPERSVHDTSRPSPIEDRTDAGTPGLSPETMRAEMATRLDELTAVTLPELKANATRTAASLASATAAAATASEIANRIARWAAADEQARRLEASRSERDHMSAALADHDRAEPAAAAHHRLAVMEQRIDTATTSHVAACNRVRELAASPTSPISSNTLGPSDTAVEPPVLTQARLECTRALDDAKVTTEQFGRALDTAERLGRLTPGLRNLADKLATARADATQAATDLVELRERRTTLDEVDAELASLVDQRSRLEFLVDTGRAQVEASRAADAATADLEAIANRLSTLADDETDLMRRRAAADKDRANLPDAEQAAAEATRVVRRVRERDQLENEQAEAEAALARSRAAHEAALDAFAAAGAPRLAAELVSGDPCPVCGSRDHPDPASTLTPDLVSLETVNRSLAVSAQSATALDQIRGRIANLRDELGDDAGISEDEGLRRADLARGHAEALRRSASSAADLSRAHDRLRASIASLQGDSARLEERSRHLAAELDRQAVAMTGSPPLDDLEDQLRALRHRERELAAAVASRDGVDRSIAACEATEQAARTSRESLEREQSRLEGEMGHLTEDLARQASALDVSIDSMPASFAPFPDETLDEIRRQLELGTAEARARTQRLETLRIAVEAAMSPAEQLAALKAQGREARADLAVALKEAGLRTAAEALALRMNADAADAARTRVTEWDDAARRLEGAFETLGERPPPTETIDESVLAEAATQAEAAHEAATRRLARTLALVEQAQRHLEAHDRTAESMGGAAADAQLLRRVADVCAGQNRERTTLESWVLAGYLDEVVRLANSHLATMSGQRYRLTVAESSKGGKGLGGLDLDIEDAVTGRTRSPLSLSGGETFQASLALALGVADIVADSVGTVEVGALFIDEGFGSLDPVALDQAIDVLDQLRSRGQLVGVITHIDAVKAALDIGIEVRRRPDGNGSELRHLGASA